MQVRLNKFKIYFFLIFIIKLFKNGFIFELSIIGTIISANKETIANTILEYCKIKLVESVPVFFFSGDDVDIIIVRRCIKQGPAVNVNNI